MSVTGVTPRNKADPAGAGAARVKGPRVWLDMDQKELDDAYDQRVYAPNQPLVQRRRNAASARAREVLGPPERLAYGPSEIEKLDIYRSKRANAPINVFIHGGAWRAGAAKDFCGPAEMFVNAGASFVVPDFLNVDEAGGSLFPMVEQVRRAIAFVYRHAARFGGNPQQLYLTSHSSGSHLTGCALTSDWSGENLPRDFIKGAVLASGMYDLAPVRLSKRSLYVKFTDAMEQELSAIRHLDRLTAPIVLAYGTEETPEFQRQTRDFFAAVRAAGKPAELLVAEACNHFEVAETLANPYGLLGRAALKQMGLGA